MLHKVNFLPWRDIQRRKHKQGFILSLLLCVILTLVVQFGSGHYLASKQVRQSERLRELDAYITKANQEIAELSRVEQKHKAQLARLSTVEQLQIQRNQTTQLLNTLPTLIPDGVYLDSLIMQTDKNMRTGKGIKMSKITLRGISDTTARLASMLNNLEHSANLSGVEIHSIVHDKLRFGHRYQAFDVSFFISSQSNQGGT